MMSTSSIAQYQDYSAIEAALKETARGEAFLADYARRVQQSHSLTILAMLSRLERVSDDLAARLAQLERVKDPLPPEAGLSQLNSTSAPRQPTSPNPAHFREGRESEMIDRIEFVTATLGDLHRRAVHLTARRGGADTRPDPAMSLGGGNAQVPAPPETGPLPSHPASHPDVSDEDVLSEIAKALGS